MTIKYTWHSLAFVIVVLCTVYLSFADYVVLIQVITNLSLLFLLGNNLQLRTRIAWNVLVIPLLMFLPAYIAQMSFSWFVSREGSFGVTQEAMFFLSIPAGYLYLGIPVQVFIMLALATTGYVIVHRQFLVRKKHFRFGINDIFFSIAIVSVTLTLSIILAGGSESLVLLFSNAGSLLIDHPIFGFAIIGNAASHGLLGALVFVCCSLKVMKIGQTIVLAVMTMILMQIGIDIVNRLTIPEYVNLVSVWSSAKNIAVNGIIVPAMITCGALFILRRR